MMAVPNTVRCTSREYVHWRQDARVRCHQLLSCIMENLKFFLVYLGVFAAEFHRQIQDLWCAFPLHCLRCPACPSVGFALTSPAEASVYLNLGVSGGAGVWGGLGYLRGQCRALLSSLSVCIPSAIDSQTSPEMLLVFCCASPRNNFGPSFLQEFFFPPFYHFKSPRFSFSSSAANRPQWPDRESNSG